MLNFQQIQKASRKTGELQEQRHHESRALYDRGRQFFEEAVANDYDNALLEKAGNSFIKGITLNRTDPYNYIGLAYLLILVGRGQEALKPLKAAKSLDPQNPQVDDLINKAQHVKVAPSTPQISALNNMDNIDYDKLYDQIEAAILQQLKAMMEQQSYPIVPTLAATQVQAMSSDSQALQETYTQISKHIEIVDEEIDTTELRNRLKPFETRLKQYENALTVSRKFSELKADIQEQLNQVQAEHSRIHQQDTVTLEAQLNHRYDHCDRIADELDTLEQQSHSIRELEVVYNSLIGAVEAFQTAVDDMEG